MEDARALFRETLSVTKMKPERVTTDGHNSYPGTIEKELGEDVIHRTNRYLNNLIEQDHRGIKQRNRPYVVSVRSTQHHVSAAPTTR